MKRLDPAALLALILAACDRTGGSLTPPHGPYGDHLAELRLLGVSATGETPHSAINNWRCAAYVIERAATANMVTE